MQHYVDPNSVMIACEAYVSRRLIKILETDGQIVPILVHNIGGHNFTVTDSFQAARVLAFRELNWPTILIEDEWTEGDL